jgi:hypothetical protein
MARAGCRARLGAQPAALELGHRRVEVAHPETQYRRISLQVLGQQAWPAACQPHLRDSRAEGPDGEDDLGAHDARVEADKLTLLIKALEEALWVLGWDFVSAVELVRWLVLSPGDLP